MSTTRSDKSNSNDEDVQDVSLSVPFFVKNLKFINPGPALEEFIPEQSVRQEKKLRRIMQINAKQKLGKKSIYDDCGFLISDGRDICDCMQVKCPGCFFPCEKCKSTKCGQECRCLRKWHYETIEVEGGETRYFPEKFVRV